MENQTKLNDIIAGCQSGCHQSYSQLIDIYAKRCYGYFYRLSGDTTVSNDLLSDLFLKLVENIGSFKGGSFEKWLFTIASNIFHDHLRAHYRQKKLLNAKIEELKLPNPNAKPGSEMADKLQRQMSKLDDETAQLITLRFYSQLSFKELAELRSEPIGTTLSKVHRGLKKLRELMETCDD